MPPSAPIGDKKNIVKMAYIYFQEGRWDKAIEEYKKLLNLDPEDINTHNMLGDVFVKKGAFREAYEEYVRVVTELSNRGQNDKAAVVNKKISALDPAKLPPEARSKQNLIKRTLQAEEAMEKGDYQTAIDSFGEVIKIDPDNIGIYSKLAEMLVAKGKTPEAIQQYAVMGGAYLKNRMYKKAQESFQKILELDPNQVEARVNLAQIFIKQGSESDAKKEYLTVAEIYLRQGELDKAQQFAHKSVELKGIEAYFILGQTLFKKKQFSEAKIELDNLLRFKVNHVGGLTYLGLVFLELNQLDKAAEQFARAQKIDKENPKILEALAELNIKKGAKAEALALLSQVSAWYLGKKDHKKALEIARKAEALDDQSPQAVKLLGDALAEDGQKVEAAQVLTRAADLFEKKNQGELAEPLRKKAKELEEAQAASTVASQPPPPPVVETPPVETESEAPTEVPAVAVSSTPAKETMISKEEVEAPSDQVLDLEDETVPGAEAAETPSPVTEAALSEPVEIPVPPPVPAPVVAEKPVDIALDRETQLHSQMEIAGNYIQQNMVEDAIEIYQQLLENYPDHPEVKARLNDAYTLYVKGGDEVIDALEAERKAKEDEEKRLREEKERRAKEDQELKAKAESERKVKEDAERCVREEAEIRAREEALQKAKSENERKAKEEEERRQKEDQLQKAKAEAERFLREDLEKKVKEETERKIREELTRKVKDAEEQRLKEEQERRAKMEIERLQREELEKKSKEEAERLLREELDRKAKEEAERRHKEEEDRKARKEAERKEREDAEIKQREAREHKEREELERSRREKESRDQALEPPRVGAGVPDAAKSARLAAGDDSHDEFMTIAVADIYVRQGLLDEAQKIYGRIVDTEPDNFEAKKKLSDLENMMRAKGLLPQNAAPAPASVPPPVHLPPVEVVVPAHAAVPPVQEPVSAPEPVHPPAKEAVAKKKPGKVGYC